MDGVDTADQLVKYYHMERRSTIWYKKLFFHLPNIAVNNNALFTGSILDQKYPLCSLDWIPSIRCHIPLESTLNVKVELLVIKDHREATVSTTTNHVIARQCRVCNKTNKRVADDSRKRIETMFCCKLWGDVPLCPAPRFEAWHTKLNA